MSYIVYTLVIGFELIPGIPTEAKLGMVIMGEGGMPGNPWLIPVALVTEPIIMPG